MRHATFGAFLAIILVGAVSAKLPPLSDEAKVKAAEAAAKASWTDKVGLYKVCAAMDRVADAYHKTARSAGNDSPAAPGLAPCADPGPFAAPATLMTPSASKPLEASGAHSPPGMAVSPPSMNATAAQMAGSAPKK